MNMAWTFRARAVYYVYSAITTVLSYPVSYAQAIRQSWPRQLLDQRLSRGLDVKSRRQDADRPSMCLWVHAASVGESLSALRVAREFAILSSECAGVHKDSESMGVQNCLREKHAQVVLTVSNRTALRILEQKISLQSFQHDTRHVLIVVQMCPFDSPGCIRRFLDAYRPDMLALIESELWPSLVYQACQRKMQLLLFDAKLSSKSLRRWRRSKLSSNLLTAMLSSFQGVSTPSRTSRALLADSGIEIRNLKFTPPLKFIDLDHELRSEPPQELMECRHAQESISRPPEEKCSVTCWAAVSTHEGEEEMVVRAHVHACRTLKALGQDESKLPRLIIVPRHVSRSRSILNSIFRERVSCSHGDVIAGKISTGSAFELESWTGRGDTARGVYILTEMGT